jgi:hypothetical protein
VWFVGGTFGNSVERTFSVPAGKTLFVPVHPWIFGSAVFDCDPTNPGVPCDVPTLRAAAAAAATGAEVVEARIDDRSVDGIRDFRTISPEPFPIVLPEGAVFGIPAGTYFPQVADGYWLMLAPLSHGEHTIQLHVVNSAFALDETQLFHIDIQ